MFGWFRPKCPIAVDVRVQLEDMFRELIDRIGLRRLQSCEVLTPDSPELAEVTDGLQIDVPKLLDLISRRMGLESGRIDLEICPQNSIPTADQHLPTSTLNGLYLAPDEERSRPLIYLNSSLLNDPPLLLATLAHEVAHEVLRREFPEAYDDTRMELLTDMLPVFLGLGIFAANSYVRERGETLGLTYSYTCQTSGYLSISDIAYIMALFAWIREESHPAWATALQDSARKYLRANLRYLRRTGDSTVTTELIGQPRKSRTIDDVMNSALNSRQPAQLFSALQMLQIFPDRIGEFSAALILLIRSGEVPLRALAVSTACCITQPARELSRVLLDQYFDGDCRVRAALAQGLSPRDEATSKVLYSMLADSSRSVAVAAARSLADCASLPPETFSPLCRLLRECINHCDEADQRAAIHLLRKFPDADRRVLEQVGVHLFDEFDVEDTAQADVDDPISF